MFSEVKFNITNLILYIVSVIVQMKQAKSQVVNENIEKLNEKLQKDLSSMKGKYSNITKELAESQGKDRAARLQKDEMLIALLEEQKQVQYYTTLAILHFIFN